MSNRQPGEYLVIEGIDGSGKSLQSQLLHDYLENQGVPVCLINEPGGTPIGDEIRRILKDPDLSRSPESNVDLFMVARRELRRQVLEPLNDEGITLISDRNWFSTLAYQGYGEGLSLDYISHRAEESLFYNKYTKPHGVIIDVPVETAIDRTVGRGGRDNDYFDRKGRDYFEKVATGYRYISGRYNLELIDGARQPELVHKDIVSYLGSLAIIS